MAYKQLKLEKFGIENIGKIKPKRGSYKSDTFLEYPIAGLLAAGGLLGGVYLGANADKYIDIILPLESYPVLNLAVKIPTFTFSLFGAPIIGAKLGYKAHEKIREYKRNRVQERLKTSY